MLADELSNLGDTRVILHLEHGAGDLVLLPELGEALVGVLVHGAELPHAEGSQTTVGTGAANADLTIEGATLALQSDGRGQHQAGHSDDDEHGTAEHDVECALHCPICQARAVPVNDGLHGLVTAGALAPVHGLGNQCRPAGAQLFVTSLAATVKLTSPLSRDPPIGKFKNCERTASTTSPLRFAGNVERQQLPKCGVTFAHVH